MNENRDRELLRDIVALIQARAPDLLFPVVSHHSSHEAISEAAADTSPVSQASPISPISSSSLAPLLSPPRIRIYNEHCSTRVWYILVVYFREYLARSARLDQLCGFANTKYRHVLFPDLTEADILHETSADLHPGLYFELSPSTGIIFRPSWLVD